MTDERTERAHAEIRGILEWVEDCSIEHDGELISNVDAVALERAANKAYSVAFSAARMQGVMGYSQHTKSASIRERAVGTLREAMCMSRFEMSFKDVDILDSVLRGGGR